MDGEELRAPVSGSCARCGCRLGYAASRAKGGWYCCGACAGSDACICGCKPEVARPRDSSLYVPTRRMFAARQPDGLKRDPDASDPLRSFPFPDPDPDAKPSE